MRLDANRPIMPRMQSSAPQSIFWFRRLLPFIALLVSACAQLPTDPVAAHLGGDEKVVLRIHAVLLHGHDMQEPSYDSPQGYTLPPTYEGELLVTDARLLFANADGAVVSIPYQQIARARPSPSPLLNYLIVWDLDAHPDSFVVDAGHVKALHTTFAHAWEQRRSGGNPTGGAMPAARH